MKPQSLKTLDMGNYGDFERFVPTLRFRWFIDTDRSRTLQQGFIEVGDVSDPDGQYIYWRDIDEVSPQLTGAFW